MVIDYRLIFCMHSTSGDVEWVKGLNLNPLFIPSSYHKVDEVPKLGSGKLDLKGLKKMAMEISDWYIGILVAGFWFQVSGFCHYRAWPDNLYLKANQISSRSTSPDMECILKDWDYYMHSHLKSGNEENIIYIKSKFKSD